MDDPRRHAYEALQTSLDRRDTAAPPDDEGERDAGGPWAADATTAGDGRS